VLGAWVLHHLEVEFEVVDDLEGMEDVAMPEEPFEALEFAGDGPVTRISAGS
jgi:hypothetical protein